MTQIPYLAFLNYPFVWGFSEIFCLKNSRRLSDGQVHVVGSGGGFLRRKLNEITH